MSSGEKKRREKDELLNKLLNNSSLTKAFVSSFSVEPCDVADFVQFREIARREAASRGFSKVLMNAVKEYNRRHGEGNPQLKIATYLDSAVSSPMRVLCWLHFAGATSDGKIYCRLSQAWIQGLRCYTCRNNELRKR